MQILFVIKSIAMPGGGAERVLSDVASGLVQRGHEVTVASYDAQGSLPFYPFYPSVKYVALGVGRADHSSTSREVLSRVHALRPVARHLRPAVAVGFMHSAYVPMAFALAGTGIPTIASEHTIYHHYTSRPFEWLTVRFASKFLTAFTGISETMRQGFPTSIRRKMHVIPNPVQLVKASLRDGPAGQKLILTVGRLEPEKDHATLISAFATVACRFPDWRLRIVGEGSLRSALELQVAQLGLRDRVELPGPISSIDQEYGKAEFLVMPSKYESFGLATAEALAAGVPVIGFADCPGTNEIVVDGANGLLVRGSSRVDALAGGLARLMGSPDLRSQLAEGAPASVSHFNLEKIVSEWEMLLQSVVRSGTGMRFRTRQ